MPNRYQVAYVASFVGTFALLFSLTEFVKAKLHARGIYVSRLILYGLPKKPTDHVDPEAEMVDIFSGQYAQLIALALAFLTSALVYVKFGRGSTCLRHFIPHAYRLVP